MTPQKTDFSFYPLRGNLLVAAPSSLDLITPYVLLEQHDWFEDEIHFVRRLLRPGSCAIDVGASYGVYALTMARRCGPSGLVIAVEPSAPSMACLSRAAQRNRLSNLVLVQAALSDRPGTGHLTASPHAELNYLTEDAAGAEPVALSTLDQTLAQAFRPVDFLKLDAEGAEERILLGGERLLMGQSPLVLFERKHGDVINTGLCRAFAHLGYRTYRLLPGPQLLVPVDPAAETDPFQLNLFACKPDRASALCAEGLLCQDLPESAALPPCDERLYEVLLADLPYGRAGLPAWANIEHPEAALYRAALSSYARAHLFPGEPPGHRVRALLDGMAAAQRAVAAHPGPARLLTLARIAAELGHRTFAVSVIGRLCAALNEGPLQVDEPFLPPLARFDALDPQGQLGLFCVLSTLEARERLRAFSSYYTGQDGLPTLRLMQRLAQGGPPGLLSDEIARRVELIVRRLGDLR
jgi:FkbM family methyltransferase